MNAREMILSGRVGETAASLISCKLHPVPSTGDTVGQQTVAAGKR